MTMTWIAAARNASPPIGGPRAATDGLLWRWVLSRGMRVQWELGSRALVRCLRGRSLLACWMPAVILAIVTGVSAAHAQPPREVHGSSDAFAAPGIALAWGVLRGANEASTVVVLRVSVDTQRYPSLAVVGIDPFTKAERSVLAMPTGGGLINVRILRAQFADFPRTELRLFASAEAAQRGEPALLVVYHGVPDTTPEFNDAAKLEAHLATRVAAARASGGKSP